MAKVADVLTVFVDITGICISFLKLKNDWPLRADHQKRRESPHNLWPSVCPSVPDGSLWRPRHGSADVLLKLRSRYGEAWQGVPMLALTTHLPSFLPRARTHPP